MPERTRADIHEIRESIAALGPALERLVSVMRDDIHRDGRRGRSLQKFGLVGVVALIAMAGVNFASIRQAQQSSATAERTLMVIQDCTDVAGECAQRNQQATVAAVGNLNAEAERRKIALDAHIDGETDELVERLLCVQRTGVDCPPDAAP